MALVSELLDLVTGSEPARAAYVGTGFEPVAIVRSDDWTRELGCDGSELLLAEVRSR